ncbi:hypothetical protein F5Y04DRAFT_254381 [Hypomontagnella monticulosa]|nr:hypothetical protein F5Y04DRAFT_254381 [Hypomontagnella monticulosa]
MRLLLLHYTSLLLLSIQPWALELGKGMESEYQKVASIKSVKVIDHSLIQRCMASDPQTSSCSTKERHYIGMRG